MDKRVSTIGHQAPTNIRNLIHETQGARLKALREGAGLTQQQLAEKAGLSIATISALERNLYDMRISSLQRIARVLGKILQIDTSILIPLFVAELPEMTNEP